MRATENCRSPRAPGTGVERGPDRATDASLVHGSFDSTRHRRRERSTLTQEAKRDDPASEESFISGRCCLPQVVSRMLSSGRPTLTIQIGANCVTCGRRLGCNPSRVPSWTGSVVELCARELTVRPLDELLSPLFARPPDLAWAANGSQQRLSEHRAPPARSSIRRRVDPAPGHRRRAHVAYREPRVQ
jgi:hypothetical protein